MRVIKFELGTTGSAVIGGFALYGAMEFLIHVVSILIHP